MKRNIGHLVLTTDLKRYTKIGYQQNIRAIGNEKKQFMSSFELVQLVDDNNNFEKIT